jgi:competence protein ComEC
MLNVTIAVNKFDSADIEEKTYTIEGVVKDIEESSSGAVLIIKRPIVRDSQDYMLEYNVLLEVPAVKDVKIGNRVSFTAVVFNRYVNYENAPNITNILEKTKYSARVSSAKNVTVVNDKTSVFGSVYYAMSNTLKSGLNGNQYGVAIAMLTGNSDYVSGRLMDSFRFAGVAHIFAVSGLHVGVLAGALGFVSKILPKSKRKYASPFILGALIFYSGVCGFTASSIRAVIMYSVLVIVPLFEERYDGISSLSFAGFVTLIFMPFQMFSAGFLLSYSATLSIIMLNGVFMKLFAKLPNGLAQSFSVGLSAFLGGVPICIKYFGYLSPISLLLNVVFLPIVSIVFIYIICAVVVGMIFNVGFITLFPANYVLLAINTAFEFINFETMLLRVNSFGIFSILYYFSLLLLAGLMNFKKKTKIVTFLIAFILSCSGPLINTVIANNRVDVYLTSSYENYATLITNRDTAVLVINNVGVSGYDKINYALYSAGQDDVDLLVFADMDENVKYFIKDVGNTFKVEKILLYSDFVTQKIEGIPVSSLRYGDDYNCNEFSVSFIKQGKGARVTYKDESILLYSSLSYGESAYHLIDGRHDMVIASNYSDELASFYDIDVIDYAVRDVKSSSKNKGLVRYKIN